MLVLSRRREESIMVGENVEVKIIDIRGKKVRLGISAPQSVTINRREVHDAIQHKKAEKAKK